jgi:hypothetical protein
LLVVSTGGITQPAGDAIPFGFIGILKLPAVSPRERQQKQRLSRRLYLPNQPLPTFCLLSSDQHQKIFVDR